MRVARVMEPDLRTVTARVVYATREGRPIELVVPVYPHFDAWTNGATA